MWHLQKSCRYQKHKVIPALKGTDLSFSQYDFQNHNLEYHLFFDIFCLTEIRISFIPLERNLIFVMTVTIEHF